jgi:hypothetical protein
MKLRARAKPMEAAGELPAPAAPATEIAATVASMLDVLSLATVTSPTPAPVPVAVTLPPSMKAFDLPRM